MLKQVSLKITGRVQGVFFRVGIKETADALGITGWVKNELDGSVTVTAEAKEEDLQKLIEWCRKGTELSRVEEVKIKWEEAAGELKEFTLQ